MIRNQPWHRVPAAPVLQALPSMTWQRSGEVTPAAETAALMLFVALNFMAEQVPSEKTGWSQYVAASYDDLGHATSLSRNLISLGLQRLISLQLISAEGSAQKRRYRVTVTTPGWFKLPCQAIVSGGVIRPFKEFTLRTKTELHAMKLYLYLASCRDNKAAHSMAAYKTIHEKTGVPERDIRKAIGFLIGCNLLVGVDRHHSRATKTNEPNKYFLAGYQKLFQPSQGTTVPNAASAVTA